MLMHFVNNNRIAALYILLCIHYKYIGTLRDLQNTHNCFRIFLLKIMFFILEPVVSYPLSAIF